MRKSFKEQSPEKITKDDCTPSKAVSHYRDIEEKHKRDILQLNKEILSKKLELESRLQQDHQVHVRELEDHLENVQRQCEEIEVRFHNQRQKLVLENETIVPRMQQVEEAMTERLGLLHGEHANKIERARDELEALQREAAEIAEKAAEAGELCEAIVTEDGRIEMVSGTNREDRRRLLSEVRERILQRSQEVHEAIREMEGEFSETDKEFQEAIGELADALEEKEGEYVALDGEAKTQMDKIEKVMAETSNAGEQFDREYPLEAKRHRSDIEQLAVAVHDREAMQTKQDREMKHACEDEMSRCNKALNEKRRELEESLGELTAKFKECKDHLESLEGAEIEIDDEHKDRLNGVTDAVADTFDSRSKDLEDEEVQHGQNIMDLEIRYREKEQKLQEKFLEAEAKEKETLGEHEEKLAQCNNSIEAKQNELQDVFDSLKQEEESFLNKIAEIHAALNEDRMRAQMVGGLFEGLREDAVRDALFVEQVGMSTLKVHSSRYAAMQEQFKKLAHEHQILEETVEKKQEEVAMAYEQLLQAMKADGEAHDVEIQRHRDGLDALNEEILKERKVLEDKVDHLEATLQRERIEGQEKKDELLALLDKLEKQMAEENKDLQSDIQRRKSEQEHMRMTQEGYLHDVIGRKSNSFHF